MSSASVSASGPTTTCTTFPDFHDAVGAGALERPVVDLGRVFHLGPQSGDAGLDLDDVGGAAESGQDLLGLVGHQLVSFVVRDRSPA